MYHSCVLNAPWPCYLRHPRQTTASVLLYDSTYRDRVNVQVINKEVFYKIKETAELIPEYKWGFTERPP